MIIRTQYFRLYGLVMVNNIGRNFSTYMSFDMVELWQEPKTEQTALQAAVPAQHARLLMLRIPPILSALH